MKLKPIWSKKPTTNKVTSWNYSKENGDIAFEQLTDEFAPSLNQAIETIESIDELYDWYEHNMYNIKMTAYGKTTSTIKRAQKIDDDKMWHSRLNQVTESITSLGKTKINDKIWELRSKTSTKYTDKQFFNTTPKQVN